MIKKLIFYYTTTIFTALVCTSAHAHFGMVIPTSGIVTQEKKVIDITLSFSHPFEGIGMDLIKPKKFYVFKDGKQTSLLSSLTETQVMGHKGWHSRQKLQRPGVYQYVMEPSPYWEAAEDLFIIHYTKTIVAAYGADENWDQPVGLPTEIIPFLRPYGNYAGNSFSGQVLMNGKAVPHAKIEVEYYNSDKIYHPPSDYHITQVVKADKNGVFSFTCPLSGWWGFSALNEADFTLMGPDNTNKNVELGAVLWVFFNTLQKGSAK
jgi:cobalt/nickel transport protein